MNKGEYSNAFSQLSEIIKNMKKELRNKIPIEVIDSIERSKNEDYIFKYNPAIPLNQQNLLPETKSLLSVIYSDYLCDESEKEKWNEYDRYETEIIENAKKEKYDENFFKNSRDNGKNQTASSTALVVKERWYNKIFSRIKSVFKK